MEVHFKLHKVIFVLIHTFAEFLKQTFVSEFELMHVDEFIDGLLHEERMCDVILPRLQVS